MTSKEQKKLQKKKARQKENHKKDLEKYEARMAPLREERDFVRKLKRIDKLKKDMADMNRWTDEVLMAMPESTLTQLEKNAKILKALEEAHQQEEAKRQEINESLESQGFKTLEQKLEHLHNQLAEEQERRAAVESGHASELDIRAGNRREVSEVTVIKAPIEPTENSTENSVPN